MIEILSILGSAPFGALIGGLLGIWNRKVDVENMRLDQEHERGRWTHEAMLRDKDLQQANIEAAGRRDVALQEKEGTIEVARMEAIARAQAADRVDPQLFKASGKFGKFFLVLLTFFQGIIRPLLTVALVGTALWINLELILLLRGKTWGTLDAKLQLEISMLAINWTTGQASACIQYWMVSRGTGK